MDEDEYRIVTMEGVPGPTWRCDDLAEAEAIALEHGYTVLDVTDGADGGTWLMVAA